jgi:DNA polymerase-3 subunit epsilon
MKILRGALDHLFGGPKVGGHDEERLRRWLALPAAPLALPHARARYVVIATETSGPGRRRDRLLAIDAVAVARMQIDLASCFTAVLRQEHASADANVLHHGIGGQAQREGMAPELAMLAFLEFLDNAPMVGFGSIGGQAVIARAVKAILGVSFRHPWIDLAVLLPALYPEAGCSTLSEWLDRHELRERGLHAEGPGAIVVAQLLQVALDAATRTGMVNAWQLIGRLQASRPDGSRPGTND